MTLLTKKLSREVDAYLPVDKMSRGRRIIVEIEAPDFISFRWKGTRRRYTALIPRLMQWTIQATVETQRKEKAKQRALKKKGLSP